MVFLCLEAVLEAFKVRLPRVVISLVSKRMRRFELMKVRLLTVTFPRRIVIALKFMQRTPNISLKLHAC